MKPLSKCLFPDRWFHHYYASRANTREHMRQFKAPISLRSYVPQKKAHQYSSRRHGYRALRSKIYMTIVAFGPIRDDFRPASGATMAHRASYMRAIAGSRASGRSFDFCWLQPGAFSFGDALRMQRFAFSRRQAPGRHDVRSYRRSQRFHAHFHVTGDI